MLLILQFLNMDYLNIKPGNLLSHFEYPLLAHLVVGVDKYYIKSYFFNDKEKENLFQTPINQFLAIPLSIEWLKKAGYKQLKRVEKTYSLGNFEDNSAIYFTGVRFIHIKTNVHIEFLHELQQLHSVLFKEELKFN